MLPVVRSIPLAMRGIDLVGQFLKPPLKYEDVVVDVDYFSNWVEVAPLRNTTADAIEEFLWKNIITRYIIPKNLVSDNEPQFDARITKLGIEHRFAPVCYPQYCWKSMRIDSIYYARCDNCVSIHLPVGLNAIIRT
ncbi:hypothetical protein LIER_44087 [Lithospermum erythrorhizon]|uniref:Integrase catalytic domain-containing protein n=1 Tax=Lithospermum erythrorhizon TaxID=34254 RepID=A0AAV3PC15_LITER